MNHGMDTNLALCANDGTRKDRDSGGEKDPLLDDRAVDMGVGSHEHVLAKPRRRAPAATHKRVLHDHGAVADVDATVLGAHDSPEQNPRAGADVHITAQD